MIWIAENSATILLCAVLMIIVAGIIAHMIRNRRKGKSACGCGCGSCAMKDDCRSRK